MPDPFETLRMPVSAVQPDPAFAARLRERVARALGLSMESPVTNQPLQTESSPATAAPDALREGDIGYVSLWVRDAGRAATFFADVLGWQFAPAADQDSRQVTSTALSHGIASLRAVGSQVWGPRAASTLFLCFCVDDVDASVERVRSAGGQAEEPTNQPYGRLANCVDDQAMPFALYMPPVGYRPSRRAISTAGSGQVAYIAIGTRDADRARAFFETVLGWRFRPGSTPGGWEVPEVVPMTGMMGGHDAPAVVPMYQVDDIEAAVARVRAAGGQATNPIRAPYGLTSTCTDDQGTSFYLGQF
ncbi:MAG: VOC family protein [Chloroflexi bacterium]|nr:VOC family protein [Chloroflexota bacterium]